MRTNLKARSNLATYEGAPAKAINAEAALRRSVMSCLLFEREFYEDGEDIASRIERLVGEVVPEAVSAIAIDARQTHNLRHVPLLLASTLARTAGGPIVGDTVAGVIQRADEVAEFLAIYWKDGRCPIDHQVKKGLRTAFHKFDAYQLAKYDRDNVVKLRDVMRMVHPKPANDEQAVLWKGVIDRTLEAPGTWEVALSGGADKKETFERLLRDGKLGYLALLRNLRNMTEAKVDVGLIRDAVVARKGAHRVLPFRYVAAARAVPSLEPAIDQALCEAIAELPVLDGKTLILVDVSSSMDARLSARSDITRMDAAAALASIVPGDIRVFSFSSRGIYSDGWNWRHDGKTEVLVECPPRRGMAGVDAVIRSQEHQGTMLGKAVQEANEIAHDRLIVITDEQSHDPVPDPVALRAYMINVASAQNGVGYGRWTHIDGFSESVLRFIVEHERYRAD